MKEQWDEYCNTCDDNTPHEYDNEKIGCCVYCGEKAIF